MTSSPFLTLLDGFLHCHSTPGDEGEVRTRLLHQWSAAGLACRTHGPYAVSAERAGSADARRPTLLVCAHMDSPGFTVERQARGCLTVIPLGHPQVPDPAVAAVLKTRDGRREVRIRRSRVRSGDGGERYLVRAAGPDVRHGDRLCFRPDPHFDPATGLLTAPFLDNRLGCAATVALAEAVAAGDGPFRVVLGATACEEHGGFGAPVLARAVRPDLVVCLDATYEDPRQNVRLGGGPVLTLSDASVVLSPEIRDRLLAWAADQGLPLQTEVYNVSGTDARAFPHAGLAAPVLCLLIATRGNHSPAEVADGHDLETWLEILRRLVTAPPDALVAPATAT